MKRNETDWTVPPGDTIVEMLEERGMSRAEACRALSWPLGSFNRVCRGSAPITVALAVKLERVFGTPAQFWMNRQVHHDLHIERQKHPDTCYVPDNEDDTLGPVDDA